MRAAASNTETFFCAVAALRADSRGAVVPVFALMLLVLAGISGLAMDFARAERVKARLTQAADAATLAAARAAADAMAAEGDNGGGGRGQIIAAAEAIGMKYFETNLADIPEVQLSAFKLKVKYADGLWSANIEYEAASETTLGRAIGQAKLKIAGTSGASVTPGFPVLDVAMCVDSTGSMQATIETVKANAMAFYDNINAELAARGIQQFPLVRVRLIYLKDYGDVTPGLWDPDPQRASDFFELPDKAADFEAFAAPQVAWGGGDWAESGLECLNEAMDSSWIKIGDTPSGFSDRVTDVYPLIVVWTDASSHPVAYPNSLANPDYPPASKMPRTYGALLDKWNDPAVLDQTHKQIVFFGDPAQDFSDGETGWHEIMNWPGFTHAGTVTDANTSVMTFLAEGIAKTARGLRLTN